MDVLMLSRLQFAFATFVHFLSVPITLGLSILVAAMESRYLSTGNETYLRMAKFWGKIFLVNFALGVVGGITLEFQFGTNWSRYATHVGDIFGSLLAIEATLAFFLESTFVAVWVFGWKRVSPKLHNLSIWIVAFAANLSAFWILTANGWMQHPVGYAIQNGRAELQSFTALVTNSFAWMEFIHTLSGAYVLAGFMVMGISAWHLLRKHDMDFFKRSFNMGAVMALVFSVLVVVQGHAHGAEVAETQPTKLAAMESHWTTTDHAPQYLFLVPDPANERNSMEILPIPSGLSLLAFHSPSATVTGLKDFPAADRPPVTLTFIAFRVMIGVGFLLLASAIFAWLKRQTITDYPWFLKFLVWAIALPHIAIQTGWIVAEVGRQPWIVYGLMRTSDAVSPIHVSQVSMSLLGLFAIYALLVSLGAFLIFRLARRGPSVEATVTASHGEGR